MSWTIIVTIAAVFNALKNVVTRQVGDKVDVYTIALVSNTLMLPVLWLNVVFFSVTYTVQPNFWWLMFVMLPFEVLVMYLFFRALTNSDLTYSFPFVSFTPVFVAIGSYFVLHESLDLAVYFGVIVIVAGAFTMNVTKDLAKADFTGILYMLCVAALWGFLIPMGNLAVTYSSAQLYPAMYFSLATLCFIPLFLLKRSSPWKAITQNTSKFLYIGLFFALFTAGNWYAYANGPATPISALTMLAIPLTSLASMALYNEKFSERRLIGSIVMAIGAVIVVFVK